MSSVIHFPIAYHVMSLWQIAKNSMDRTIGMVQGRYYCYLMINARSISGTSSLFSMIIQKYLIFCQQQRKNFQWSKKLNCYKQKKWLSLNEPLLIHRSHQFLRGLLLFLIAVFLLTDGLFSIQITACSTRVNANLTQSLNENPTHSPMVPPIAPTIVIKS